MIANTVRDPEKRRAPFTLTEFHPYHRKQTPRPGLPITGESIRAEVRRGLAKQGRRLIVE